MKKILNSFLAITAFTVLTTSCIKDLDTRPIDPDEVTAAEVFDDPASYKAVLAKLYAGLAVSGQEGPAGKPDISGIDEGFGQYLRGYWYHQELTTDEAVIGWNDQTIKNFHGQSWGASDVFIAAFYYRIFYQVTACNEYIRETSDTKLDERGVQGQLRDDVKFFRAEARFLRALSYWHAMDLFGNVPFVTENDPVGAFFPKQILRADLFNYIEDELLQIESQMMDPMSNEYARADKAAVWMLLANIYLNAEVYTGTASYDKALEYSLKVINSGYSIDPVYQNIFLADNDKSPEVIFPIAFDGLNTQTWGGTTFIIHAAVGGDMTPGDYGIDGGWGGTRTTSAFVDKFPDETGDADSRAMFFTEGQTKEIQDIGNFQDGYAITKFKNITSDGLTGQDLTFPDTDFPMFRLADAYLMYAEAVLRGGGGNQATAVEYINQLRTRAYGNTGGNITSADLTLDFILDERARELFWEGHRRTDLVRFGKFSGAAYLWPWKGNTALGTATDGKYDIFPIPDPDINANPNLVQNTGY
ncbi:MAG: RagB/SusD family nutrient uptake outer membrane protein [Bacteroidales bacterium]|nr:RagB/SusD family nutrient uptake outer membrane protein [Bacteroidales bacterium]MCF6342513.1 RagB/SusD family nutrient uptake outer membrane protein [Bacteroidales bacterium]